MTKLSFRSVGECMAELQLATDGLYGLAFGGDTLNTSWYVRAIAAADKIDLEYVTALGSDPLSDRLMSFLKDHQIGTKFIREVPDRNIGLYLISLAGAERSFTYWRNYSAAKLLAENLPLLSRALSGADVIYFSGITLAILAPEHRQILLRELQSLKARGSIVAFDSNARPRLWFSEQDMKEATVLGYRSSTIALPTFADEQAIFGDATKADCARRIASYGVREVIVKDGALSSCGLIDGEVIEATPPPVTNAVDTTGAGDSFNAGYLVGRMAKLEPRAATCLAHKVAGRVICHRGALVPMSLFSDLRLT